VGRKLETWETSVGDYTGQRSLASLFVG